MKEHQQQASKKLQSAEQAYESLKAEKDKLEEVRGETVKQFAKERAEYMEKLNELEDKVRKFQKKDKEHIARANDWDIKFKEIEACMQDDKAEHDKLLKGKVDAERQVGKLQVKIKALEEDTAGKLKDLENDRNMTKTTLEGKVAHLEAKLKSVLDEKDKDEKQLRTELQKLSDETR